MSRSPGSRIGTGIALVDAADAAGCQTILTGFGAEAVLDSAPFYLADLLRRGRLGQTWLEAARWAHAQHSNPWRYIRPFAITPLKPARLAAGVKPLLRRGYAPWHEQNPLAIPPWVLPEFASRGRLEQRYRDGRRHSFPPADSVVLSEHLGAFAIRAATGSATTSAPRATFTSRTRLKTRAYSQSAWGRAPVSDRNPTAKSRCWLPRCEMCCHQASLSAPTRCPSMRSITSCSLVRNLETLEVLVRDSTVDDLGLFDKQTLIRCLRDAALGHRLFDNKAGLDNSLCIVKWLSQLPRWQSVQSSQPVFTGIGRNGMRGQVNQSARVGASAGPVLARRRGRDTLGILRGAATRRHGQLNHSMPSKTRECSRVYLHRTMVARVGIEPTTFRFSGGRSYQLSYLADEGMSCNRLRPGR